MASVSKSAESIANKEPHELVKVLQKLCPQGQKKNSNSLYTVKEKGDFETVGKLSNGHYVVVATEKDVKKTKIISADTKNILEQISRTFEKQKVLKNLSGDQIANTWLGVRHFYQNGKNTEKKHGLFATIVLKFISLFVRIPHLDTAYAAISKQFRERMRETIKEVELKDEDIEIIEKSPTEMIAIITYFGTESDVKDIFRLLRKRFIEGSEKQKSTIFENGNAEEIENRLATVFLKYALSAQRYDLIEHFCKTYDPKVDEEVLKILGRCQDVKAAKLLGIDKDQQLKAKFFRICTSGGVAGSKEMLKLLSPSEKLIHSILKV